MTTTKKTSKTAPKSDMSETAIVDEASSVWYEGIPESIWCGRLGKNNATPQIIIILKVNGSRMIFFAYRGINLGFGPWVAECIGMVQAEIHSGGTIRIRGTPGRAPSGPEHSYPRTPYLIQEIRIGDFQWTINVQ